MHTPESSCWIVRVIEAGDCGIRRLVHDADQLRACRGNTVDDKGGGRAYAEQETVRRFDFHIVAAGLDSTRVAMALRTAFAGGVRFRKWDFLEHGEQDGLAG